MINLLNQKVRHRNGEIYVVEKQDDKYLTLSNGKKFDYTMMFSSNAFVLMDDDLQKKVVMDNIKVKKL